MKLIPPGISRRRERQRRELEKARHEEATERVRKMGHCPNCQNVLPLDGSLTFCDSCGHDLGGP